MIKPVLKCYYKLYKSCYNPTVMSKVIVIDNMNKRYQLMQIQIALSVRPF